MEDKHEILEFCKDKDESTTIYAIYPCESENKIPKVLDRLGKNSVSAPILYPSKDNHSYLYSLLKFIVSQLSE